MLGLALIWHMQAKIVTHTTSHSNTVVHALICLPDFGAFSLNGSLSPKPWLKILDST